MPTFTPKEIRYGGSQAGHFFAVPVTIAQNATPLAEGTILGKITASGKYAVYADGASDGTQTAVGILAEYVDASGGDKVSHMYLKGLFVESELVGLDANGKSDLGSKSHTDWGLLIL